jgi:hypothetical protein
MKTCALVAMATILAFGSVASGESAATGVDETRSIAHGGPIASLAWNKSNIDTLRSFDKAAVVRFINEWTGKEGTFMALKPRELWDFGWFDLAGDGKYELATVVSSGPDVVGLSLLWQDAPGKIRVQDYDGAGELSDTIRDLNGDGKKELILGENVVENAASLKFFWPAVYRLENGKYVEASRDFPNFYDTEELPQLNKQISEYQRPDTHDPDRLAGLMMERNKILRVLGRDPTAGLKQAYQWMKSDDPYLLQDAAVTFDEVGGHEGESRAADEARMRVLCRDNPRSWACKDGHGRSVSH